jgi:tetratricopeptide (TPR) repeat protein
MDNSQYKTFNYEITHDPSFMDKENAMTPELHEILDSLFIEINENKEGKKTIDKLLKLIEKYPGNPQLKNLLSVAYNNAGNTTKSREVNHWIIAEHPDYLFGKLNLAAQYYEDEEYNKIPQLLGKIMEIQDLYPDRKKFHLAEVTGFNKIAILYFIATGNLEAAKGRYEIMKEIAPDHPDTEFVSMEMIKAEMRKNLDVLKERKESEINVTHVLNKKPRQTREAPVFENQLIHRLYSNGLYIDGTLITEILSLPRESLIRDLELILYDLLCRYDFFKQEVDNKGWKEEEMNFPIHALSLLGELRSESSLPKVLDILKQDDEFLDFWFGDHITSSLWEPLYYIGNRQLDTLLEFMKSPGINTYARSGVSDAVNQIAFHQPQRKEEVIEWYKNIFEFFINSRVEDNVIDSEAIGLLIGNVVDLQATSLIPEIEKLYALGFASINVMGELSSVLRDITKKPAYDCKKELMSILDRYHEITTTWAGYTEDDDEHIFDDFEEIPKIMPVKTEPKIGRNDPCPCGSGKKYKNCCLKKK